MVLKSLLLLLCLSLVVLGQDNSPSSLPVSQRNRWTPKYTAVPPNTPGLFFAADAEFYPSSFLPAIRAIKTYGGLATAGMIGVFLVVFIFQIFTRAISASKLAFTSRTIDPETLNAITNMAISAIEKYNELDGDE
ncbi:unnamed protein product [Lepeophtheirus salmonis]|uniref:(salmon louse) hypothetical protein n=1 Tax=Lepeophtheirus salmonis TaxID=72036 RepID=A0A0K2TKU8_LEPSM|nr:uncharacterized protein LOC121128501 [Lepeophtheirus salmonis]CAB4059750.1 unnamed protein product [Lepeophtheirus salmonis]CAF2852997.1 unnamed protein product [Lepeophtheirus salmonis]